MEDVEKLKSKIAILPPLSYEQTTEMIKIMKKYPDTSSDSTSESDEIETIDDGEWS